MPDKFVSNIFEILDSGHHQTVGPFSELDAALVHPGDPPKLHFQNKDIFAFIHSYIHRYEYLSFY